MSIFLMEHQLLIRNNLNNKSRIFFNTKAAKANIKLIASDIAQLIISNPYPGDLRLDSYRWITDTALYMDEIYNPHFMFLSYANLYHLVLNSPYDESNWNLHIEELFYQVGRFIDKTDYIPIILGSGGTYPIEGITDLSYLEGEANFNWPSSVYATVYNAGKKDLKYLEKDKAIQMVIPYERLKAMAEEPKEVLPDYFLIARRGYAFSKSNVPTSYSVNARDVEIPIIAPQPINRVSQVAKMAKSLLHRRKRVALIILEGVSSPDFRWTHHICSNTYSWFTYLPEELQYLTLCTGWDFPSYHIFYRFCSPKYSFNTFLNKLNLEGKTVGSKINIRSAAIGSRRNLTHLASGADIAIECGYSC
ncbi:MAG: hypothetical protein GX790_02400 [Syntrophomonadaceae bacterium]|nr:hypothetical protein [Syntrophomonadaceae bacterium]